VAFRKPKEHKYYYDFGTGKKVERAEPKEERNSFPLPKSQTTSEAPKRERDSFLEGFNDPYGEKAEQERQRKEQERKERFANIRANADNRTWSSQSTPASQSDPFLEGFNSEATEANKKKEIKENRERNEELLQRMYASQVMATTPFPANLLRIGIGRSLEEHVKEKHYERNKYNVDLPENKEEAIKWDWRTEAANCHQFTAQNGERYIKYVSPDGKREVIFNEKGEIVITADEDIGTYNYANPDSLLQHGILDVLPWIRYGNTPEDATKGYQRIGGLFNFEK